MSLTALFIISGYVVLFLVAGFAVALIRRRFNKQRPPLVFEYNRLPGESLSKRIESENEKLFSRFIICFLAPPAAGIIVFAIFYLFYPQVSAPVIIVSCSLVLVSTLVAACWSLIDGIKDVAKLELGLNGERIVADFLKPLEREGWRIFHDVPARQNGKDFNLDHVAVGPSGISLIETKSRSKGKALPGRKDHVVVFDGKKLEWPWGHSTSELEQLKRQRVWLENWLHDRIGENVSVSPILAIPGWWTECNSPRARTKVVSHKRVCEAVRGNGQASMDSKNIDLIARQLESICRTRP